MLLADRALADIRKKDDWAAARVGKIGASDAARYAKFESAESYTRAKLLPSWEGGAYADWGNEREPIILEEHGYPQNHTMFASLDNPRFVATPDGIRLGPKPRLAQVKTTVKDFRSKRTGEILVPAHYRRQVWWEQMVMGPEYTESDFIFEMHEEVNGQFVPAFDSIVVTIARDEAEIASMVRIANEVLRRLDLAID